MKKNYMKPEMGVVKIEMQQQMLVASAPFDSTPVDAINADAPELPFDLFED